MLAILVKIFKALNSEQSPNQIALGIALAVIVGFSPLMSIHNLLILLILLWFRINLTLFIVFWPIFSLLGFLFSPISESIGLSILTSPALSELWESFYNTLLGRWSGFNQAGVMGGFVCGFIAALIVFPTAKVGISTYRDKWQAKFEQVHFVKVLKASKFWQMVQTQS